MDADDPDQDELIARLAAGETFGGRAPERIDTHISVVFLTPDRAYKLKRALTVPYLDYGTLEKRRKLCEAEIEINRRTAPEIYLRAVPVTLGAEGSLALGGGGRPVEWLVEMARFDTDLTLDRVARAGKLETKTVRDLADAIAAFHEKAERIDTTDGAGVVEPTIGGNARELRNWLDAPFAASDIDRLVDLQRSRLDANRALLDARAGAGMVRRCHGDLHLRNICLIDGRPVIFDAIEFNEKFIRIDVLYDLAFLLMDFAYCGHAEFANLAFNRYLQRTGDIGGIGPLPLFQSLRAAIRAHVTAKAAGERASGERQEAMRREAAAYLDLAADLLRPATPRLIAIGGFSGTGKSTLARRLAPGLCASPGAVTISSDPIRKRLHGVAPEEKLPESAYGRDADAKVFDEMFREAQTALASGFPAILDMTFRDGELRKRAEAVAERAGVPFAGFWLEADRATLAARVEARTGDPSDATTGVLDRQLASGAGEIGWRRIDASVSIEESHDRVAAAVANMDP
jgi:aminoglycoside phosphotransferase family enzyme/predicted kinase